MTHEEMMASPQDSDTDADILADRAQAWRRDLDIITRFLGEEEQIQVPIELPHYYSDLLAWGLQRYIDTQNWKVAKVLGLHGEIPGHLKVNTDYGKYESFLSTGCLLLEREGSRVATFITASPIREASLLIASCSKEVAYKFAEGVREMAQSPNLYQGKKLLFSMRIRFLNLPPKDWNDIVLDKTTIDDINAHTVDFLNRRAEFASYGIPSRRGLILAGEPGTGKTLIVKILMNKSLGITSIVAHEGFILQSAYVSDLYEVAKDLKPSMVFIEDIDLIGQERRESNYARGQGLFALLKALDGVEACDGVVTVATTNNLELLDKALKERPSRFDRVIQVPLPALAERTQLVRLLSTQIPLNEHTQDYLARRTHDYTPAQIQEVFYSLVIEHRHNAICSESGRCEFGVEEVDNVLSKINKKDNRIGFKKVRSNGNGLETEVALCPSVGLGVEKYEERR